MLLELTVAEQRFNAVMEVIRDGLTVIEVAERYGVTARPSTAGCAATAGGLNALADRSHRPLSLPPSDAGRGRGPLWSCAASIPAGGRVGWPTCWSAAGSIRRRAGRRLPGPGPAWAYRDRAPAPPG